MMPSKNRELSKCTDAGPRKKVRWTLNRSGDQMREQADEQCIVDQRLRGLELAVVDIDEVGQFLKACRTRCQV